MRRKAIQWAERKGKKIRGERAIAITIADYLKAKDDWLPAELARLAQSREWRSAYRAIRLCCDREGCDGYYVLRHRRSGYRFAGCSTWTEVQCRATLPARTYVIRKSYTVLAVLNGQTPTERFRLTGPRDTRNQD